jgi:thioredoxin 2
MSTAAKKAQGTTRVVVCPNCHSKNRVPSAADGVPRCGSCKSALPWVVDATEADFAEVADAASIPVLVDIWAPWCGPCRQVSPVLETLATELAGRLKLVKVNADDAPHLSGRFDVKAIPTLILLDQGRVVDRQIGALPAVALRRWLEAALSQSTGSRG